MQEHASSDYTFHTVSRARPDSIARIRVASIWSFDQGQSRGRRHSGKHGLYYVDLLCVTFSSSCVIILITELDGPVTSIANITFFLLPVS